MTIYDKIKEMDKDTMVKFLYHFARDTINQFSQFILPSTESIEEFLDREVPESE